MELDELANREIEILGRVNNLDGTMDEKFKKVRNLGIGDLYAEVFEQYVKLHKKESEAMKRSLFLYWYSISEPGCYTGLLELKDELVKKVLNTLDRRLARNISDYELDWMLSYYSNWEFIFERFQKFESLLARIKNKEKTELPNSINSEEMKLRGQMGRYWNSIIKTKPADKNR